MIGADREAYYRFFDEDTAKSVSYDDDKSFAMIAAKYGVKEAPKVIADIRKYGSEKAIELWKKRKA